MSNRLIDACLQGCQRNVEDWQRILQVRSLVISPAEDVHAWLKYASLCRKSGRLVGGLTPHLMVLMTCHFPLDFRQATTVSSGPASY